MERDLTYVWIYITLEYDLNIFQNWKFIPLHEVWGLIFGSIYIL